VGVLGGPTGDGGLFGGTGHSSGLFDAPDRVPGEVPGLFDRPSPPPGEGMGLHDKPGGLFDKPAGAAGGGLFDKPARAAGGGLFDKPARAPRRK
jgi:hypothetical protein